MTIQAQQSSATNGNGALVPALDNLFVETVALYQRMRAVAPLIRTHDELDREECSVLQGLERDGGRTITDIGDEHGISRSKAQKLVKKLEKKSLIEMVPNPEKKKRAKLAAITDDGRAVVEALDQREIKLLSNLPLDASPESLRAAAAALTAVRQAFSDDDWRKLLEATPEA